MNSSRLSRCRTSAIQVLVLAMVHEYLEDSLAGAEVQVVAVLAQVNEDGFHDGPIIPRIPTLHLLPRSRTDPRAWSDRLDPAGATRPGARHSKGTVLSPELGMMTIGTW